MTDYKQRAANSRLGRQIGKGLEVRKFEIRLSRSRSRGACTGTRRRAIDPNSRDAKRVRGNHVVVNALPDMEPFLARHAESVFGQPENLEGWLIRAGLLSRGDDVKLYSKQPGGNGKNVVINVRNNGQAKLRLQLAECRHRVREWQPSSHGIR